MKCRKQILFLATIALTIFLGCTTNEKLAFEESTLESVGMDIKEIEKLTESLDSDMYANVYSFLILKDGKLVYEKYNQDNNENALSYLCSVTKTVTSILIGIAIDKGFITSIDEPVYQYFPEYVPEIIDEKFKEITIKHLLTMTDGLDWYDFDRSLRELSRNDEVLYAFKQNIIKPNGESFRYSGLDSQILSEIITKTTGLSELEFARKYLFNPLNITNIEWGVNEKGYNFGAKGLKLEPRAMMKIGKLLLDKGKSQGSQLVSSQWIDSMTTVTTNGGIPHGEKYGLHIWIDNVEDYKGYFAGGFGGQFIYVVPEMELVVVITSAVDGHREFHRDLIPLCVIPAVK